MTDPYTGQPPDQRALPLQARQPPEAQAGHLFRL